MELAVAAFLRALGPEARTHVIQLLHPATLIQPMLQVGTYDRRRDLGTQHVVDRAALEGKHLFTHDVGQLPDAARNQFGRFKDGGTDLLISKPAHYLPNCRLDVLPGRRPGPWRPFQRRGLGQEVEGAF